MFRRRALHALFILGIFSSVSRADEAFVPPTVSVQVSGGATARQTSFAVGGAQLRESRLTGVSPTFFRLDAQAWFLRFLGVELEGSGDVFRADNGTDDLAAQRWGTRAGVALRYVTDGGFTLSGALGYGLSWAPVIRYRSAAPTAGQLFTHGPTARAGVGLTKGRFDGSLNATVLVPVAGDARVLGFEPRLWLAGRFLDVGPSAWWLGADVGALIESGGAYGGVSVRFAVALRVTFGPPRVSSTVIEGQVDEAGTLVVRVSLPDGAVAKGAQVSVDGAAAVTVDDAGEVKSAPSNGTHAVTVSLAGFRSTSASGDVAAGQQRVLEVRLAALTGPGRLGGVVRAAAGAKPLVDAVVNVAEQSARTDASGAYVFEKVGPGPVQVRVDAQGFNTSEEVAQVPAEGAASLDFALEPLGKGSPATVRGLVRSRSGVALKAAVVVRGSKQKVVVTPEGRFVATLPAGDYTFIISAPGHIAQTKKVTLADGEQAIFHCELLKVTR